MKMLKKSILSIAIILAFTVLFAGCNEDSNLPPDDNTITVTFQSDYGHLSFNSKEFSLNEQGKALIKIQDCPTISDEGDAKIFNCWTSSDGQEVNFDEGFVEDTVLKAKFKDASFVVEAKWQKNQSFLDLRNNVHSKDLLGHTQTSSVDTGIRYEKMANDEIDANGYITKEQFVKLESACFVTSSNSQKKYIKTTDYTLDTYYVEVYIVISNSDNLTSIGYFDYIPHGERPNVEERVNLASMIQHRKGVEPTSTAVFNQKRTTYVGQDTPLTNNQITISAIRNHSNLETSEEFNEFKNYYIFIEVSGYKYSIKENGQEKFFYTDKDSGQETSCQKEDYDSINQNYYLAN